MLRFSGNKAQQRVEISRHMEQHQERLRRAPSSHYGRASEARPEGDGFRALHAHRLDRRREDRRVEAANERLVHNIAGVWSPLNRATLARDYQRNREQARTMFERKTEAVLHLNLVPSSAGRQTSASAQRARTKSEEPRSNALGRRIREVMHAQKLQARKAAADSSS